MGWLKPLAQGVNLTNEWIGRILSVGILPITLLVVFEVVMRYALRSPTVWGTELLSQLFAGYILLGGGYTLLHRAHVNMDVVYVRLRPRTQAVLDVLTAAVVFLYCIMLNPPGRPPGARELGARSHQRHRLEPALVSGAGAAADRRLSHADPGCDQVRARPRLRADGAGPVRWPLSC